MAGASEREIQESATYIFGRVKLNVEKLGNTSEKHLVQKFGAVLKKMTKYLHVSHPNNEWNNTTAALTMQLIQRLDSDSVIAGATHPDRNQYRHLSGALVATVPILIPTFNNVTYLRRMIEQLKAYKLRNIIVIDNASTLPDMFMYLDEIEHEATVVKLNYNDGPRAPFLNPENYARLPDIFCITDPDLVFNEALPKEFMFSLINATEILKVGKAGFAIDISEPELMSEKALAKQHFDGQHNYGLIEWGDVSVR